MATINGILPHFPIEFNAKITAKTPVLLLNYDEIAITEAVCRPTNKRPERGLLDKHVSFSKGAVWYHFL